MGLAVFKSLGGRNPVTGDYDANVEKTLIPEDITDPTFLFDTDGVRLKFGSFDNVIKDGRFKCASYNFCGYPEMADSLWILTVPDDQELVDNLVNNSFFFIDYVKQRRNEWMKVTEYGVIPPLVH